MDYDHKFVLHVLLIVYKFTVRSVKTVGTVSLCTTDLHIRGMFAHTTRAVVSVYEISHVVCSVECS